MHSERISKFAVLVQALG